MTEPSRRFDQVLGRKALRKWMARQRANQGPWYGLGMFGLIGWSVAVPTLVGIALGLWLDRLLHSRISWTLTLLMLGVLLGCLNAWYWVRQEEPHDD